MRIFVKLSSFLVKLSKPLQYAAINWIEKGILVNIFGDILHKLILH